MVYQWSLTINALRGTKKTWKQWQKVDIIIQGVPFYTTHLNISGTK